MGSRGLRVGVNDGFLLSGVCSNGGAGVTESSRTAAFRHAQMIRAFWAKRGYTVRCEVIPVSSVGIIRDGKGDVYTVKSNMVNAMPMDMPVARRGIDYGGGP